MMAIAENTPPLTFEWWSFGSSKLESPRLRGEDSAIATSNDWYSVLKYEFSAEEASFLLQLRCDFVWDRAAFSRLTEAMLACCKVYDAGIGGSHDWQSDDESPANKEIARALLGVSAGAVSQWLKRARETGGVEGQALAMVVNQQDAWLIYLGQDEDNLSYHPALRAVSAAHSP